VSPSKRTIYALCALAALSIGPSLDARAWPVWLAAAGVFAAALCIDAWRLRHIPFTATRQVSRVIAHQQHTKIEVTVTNNQASVYYVEAHDGHPPHCDVDQQPAKFVLDAHSSSTFKYRLRSSTRGVLNFDGVHCRVRSSLGLWRKKQIVALPDEVKVFPNFQANRLFGLLLSRHSLSAMGVKRRRLQGEGSDFHQLREFRDGDSLRQIDWKATSRVQKLISREYQQERDQQIVFLLDCSMRMRHEGEQSSHMDNALNAVVLLSHVALRQGDATGLKTFGGVDRWIPPAKGPKSASRLMNGVFDIEATHQMPDYDGAVEELAQHLKKRALIILVTNLRNEDGDAALNALQRLAKKHVVLIADLREVELEQALEAPTSSINEAVQWFSAEAYQQEREHRHQLARARGATLIDVAPEKLSASLISEYLAIKNSARL